MGMSGVQSERKISEKVRGDADGDDGAQSLEMRKAPLHTHIHIHTHKHTLKQQSRKTRQLQANHAELQEPEGVRPLDPLFSEAQEGWSTEN